MNESALYHTWIPSWQTPFKLGIQESNQLLHDSRGHQVIQVSVSVPWPMKPREALFSVQAVDDIETNGFIIAKMTTIDSKDQEQEQTAKNNLPDNFEVPELTPGMERCDFDGAVLFRNCPIDHPNYKATRQKFPTDDLILLQFTMHFDAKMTMVPQSAINFITRTALGVIWNMLLRVAEQVRDGSREEHCEVISAKADFYKWVEKRCNYMLHKILNNNNDDNHTKQQYGERQQHQQQQKQNQQQQQPIEEDTNWTLQEVLRMNM